MSRTQIPLRTIPLTFYQCRMNTEGVLAFTYFGARSKELWGIDAQEMLRDSSAGLNMVHPKDVQTLMASIKDSFLNLTLWDWRARLKTPDGEEKIMQGISKPELQKDESVVWNGVLYDATHSKPEELKAITNMFHHYPTVFLHFLLNKAGNIQIPYMSQASQEYWGIDSAFVTATGSKFLELIHIDDRDTLLQSIEQSVKTQKPWEWDGRIVAHNQARRVQGFSVPERLENGDTRWVGVLVDLASPMKQKRAA